MIYLALTFALFRHGIFPQQKQGPVSMRRRMEQVPSLAGDGRWCTMRRNASLDRNSWSFVTIGIKNQDDRSTISWGQIDETISEMGIIAGLLPVRSVLKEKRFSTFLGYRRSKTNGSSKRLMSVDVDSSVYMRAYGVPTEWSAPIASDTTKATIETKSVSLLLLSVE